MSEAEDDTRIIPDSTILNPFGLRIVSLSQVQNTQQFRPRIDEQEWDDTGESLLHMEAEETTGGNALVNLLRF